MTSPNPPPDQSDGDWNVAPDGSGISHVAYDPPDEPAPFDPEPWGTCITHGDYWSVDCPGCRREGAWSSSALDEERK